MTHKHLVLFAAVAAIGLASCSSDDKRPAVRPSAPSAAISTSPSAWWVDNYPRRPGTRPSSQDGFSIAFTPTPGIGYVTLPVSRRAIAGTMSMTFEIIGDGKLVAAETPNVSPRVRLFFQVQGDDWAATENGTEDSRWWSSTFAELKPGVHTISVPIEPAAWGQVWGKNGSTRPERFAWAAGQVAAVGFTFGGGYAGHGVYAESGNARFVLRSFTIR